MACSVNQYSIRSLILLFSDARTAGADDRNCEHIVHFFNEWPSVGPLFDEFFQQRSPDYPHTPFPPTQDENLEDRQILNADHEEQAFIWFDVHASLWRSKVHSPNLSNGFVFEAQM